jgi:Mlc titration factor MtfA (ptsG expression regulator)
MKKARWIPAIKRFFRPPPPEISAALWQKTLLHNAALFRHLDTVGRQRLKTLSEAFLAAKEFCGAQGLVLQDEILALIAAQACLPILELGLAAYQDWVGIIVYPDEFVVPRADIDHDGIVHQYEEAVTGEAWEGGPVILSWQDVKQADGTFNVVIHEFAHKLDMRNGATDGIPALHSGLRLDTWKTTLHQAYDDFCRRLDKGLDLPMDAYAAEDPAEFFAVASECFFASPGGLRDAYPDFYRLLRQYYRQDPALGGAGARQTAPG